MSFKSGPRKPTEVPEDLMPHITIPSELIELHPAMKLRDYDRARPDVCSNAISMVHNACRAEMADMFLYIMPYLEQRKGNWNESDGTHLASWWTGFVRFVLTATVAEEMLLKTSHADIIADHDTTARELGIAIRKLQDRNNITLVDAAWVMYAEVESFAEEATEASFKRLCRGWELVSGLLLETYTEVERVLDGIDSWRRDQLEVHKGLEKKVVGVFTDKKRWSDDARRGEMVVLLTRWIGSKETARDWCKRTLVARDLRMFDKWFEAYGATRQTLLDEFKN